MKEIKLTRRERKVFFDEAVRLHKADEAYKKADNLGFFLYVTLVVVFALALRLFVFEPIRVDGPSMEPTLFNDEQMFVEKCSYWFRTPERGEIVIVYYPGYTIPAVKRVIALPGETVAVTDGAVYINGEKLDESAYWDGYVLDGIWPFTVPEGSIFVMGDNRNVSKDSRNLLEVGPIPYYRIVGRALAVIWPFSFYRAL
ncbi:MAG: signal peptidase I [Clostridiaceae bacterium]|nr:signal peptidase I [Eubacteriales bacterium]